VKKCCKQDKQNWFDSKATEAEQAAQTGDTKTIYRLVKEIPHRSHLGGGGTSSQETEERKSCWHRPNPARTAKVLISHNSRAHKLVQQHNEEQNSPVQLVKWDYNSTSKERRPDSV